MSMARGPKKILETVLSEEGRVCPRCERPGAVAVESSVGTETWAMGKMSCAKCEWSMNIFVDLDATETDGSNSTAGGGSGGWRP